MKKYACDILYKYNEEEIITLFKKSLGLTGFESKYMSILFDEFEPPIDEVVFNEKYLLELFKRKPSTITIMSELKNNENKEDYYWFKFGLSIDSPFGLDTCTLTWSNSNLNFLIGNELFNTFLNSSNLIYCYCYDQFDAFEQSNKSMINPDFEKPWESHERSREFILDNAIDTSDHWGRYISTCGMMFMAAPVMWFGEEYFKIISKASLKHFKGASLINHYSFDLIYIKLFELYDDPSRIENREKQKSFWKTFDLEKKVEHYEKDRPIDFVKWYKERAVAKKKKRGNS